VTELASWGRTGGASVADLTALETWAEEEIKAEREAREAAIAAGREELIFPIFDAADPRYGAIGDGVTDNTEAIQGAINDANEAGGGLVYIPAGTFMTGTFKMRSNVTLRTAGRGVTVLKLIAGKTDLLSTEKLGTGGQQRYSVREVTLDGNKAGGGLGSAWNSDGQKVTGFDVEVRNGAVNGLRHRQTGAELSAAEGGDDSFFLWIWAYNNTENDILDEAHDCAFTHCRLVGPAKNGFKNTAAGTQAVLYDIHVWSKSERHERCFNFEGTWQATDCTAEGASVGLVRVKASGVWNGGRVFAVAGAENVPGFEVVESASRLITRGVVINNTGTGGAFKAMGANAGSGSDLDFLLEGGKSEAFKKAEGASWSEHIRVMPNLRGETLMGEPPPRASVASAAEIAIDSNARAVKVTGVAEVKKIKPTFAGHTVALIFTSTAKLVKGENLKIKETIAPGENGTYTIVCDGTNWFGPA
jgi:Pectate lyase superfamily protein